MGSRLRSLTRWSVAPARDVDTALTPKVNVLRGLAARATTPLLPDDYLELLNPLWSARELRGVVVEVVPETEDSATVHIKPGWGLSGNYRPGQYVGIGLRVDGRWHWRSYSLTSTPRRGKKLLSITVKATPEGFLSTHLVNGVAPGTVVRLAAPRVLFGTELPTCARPGRAHPEDTALGELVEELTSHSTEFARLWAKRCVRVNGRGLTRLLHPRVGPLTVEYEVLTPLQDPDHRVIICRAADPASQAAMDGIAREAERPRLQVL
jgi:hypothetical protein